ncbi:MAG: hypothetical protein A2898_00465 [Candidatus Kerfeldbacteria bacterium RIFCSPLOWO2_01_FULL_48_11]|uniref:Uncharacterized protein n=1 Tax=Candidatus Kerfeldbacteria bacterium RIFCSPLOWO2_01_FULL_48_11 TaxID=1798543 RepID=A0A1G2B1B2_9BACT|nr:MAG: hypothetical protein UY34_C0019G0024 [Parcubacteria group bacterium GW2011_GWA2_48_9]KKW16068.1 MAG: hypothetical protein UY52_C0011G0056 [Parcubacteria group bacterium GW2011_GWC2_49_9]OGY82983.1 MAG: hypothetical protein A2898_00465 [Candidatus Kerfeldbacteria bacterium RIFCSPLOWO2_01_FULL_48_11]HCM68533.1 hypothetical protein [Candidatus Kerfeldbacteria bacterium]
MCPFQKGDRVIVNVDGSTFTGVVEVAVGFSRLETGQEEFLTIEGSPLVLERRATQQTWHTGAGPHLNARSITVQPATA